jgi:CheY-like chemotaxis protein
MIGRAGNQELGIKRARNHQQDWSDVMAKKQKILVVDDELDMRTFIATLLETKGYKPVVASDGLEGIRLAKEEKPALIILDIMMPKEGGVQMYRDIKTDETLKGIPVIMLSGIAKKTFFHSQAMLNQYMGQAVPEPEAYIEKPPESDVLLDLTENLLKACE